MHPFILWSKLLAAFGSKARLSIDYKANYVNIMSIVVAGS